MLWANKVQYYRSWWDGTITGPPQEIPKWWNSTKGTYSCKTDGWFWSSIFLSMFNSNHSSILLGLRDICTCHPSQRYCVTTASSVCSTEHTGGPTLQTDHIRPSCIFCCGSHSVEQSSCRIHGPDNQWCLLSTAFKDSSAYSTALAP